MGLLDIVKNISKFIPNPLDPLGSIFNQVVLTNIVVTNSINIPAIWSEKVIQYSKDNPVDGALLLLALARQPAFHKGGWILDLQPAAEAITLNTDVFCNTDLNKINDGINVYVHEIVHVAQYGLLGRVGFLTSYFGLSAATIAWRLINRQPLNVVNSSPQEVQAYDIEHRFAAWHNNHP